MALAINFPLASVQQKFSGTEASQSADTFWNEVHDKGVFVLGPRPANNDGGHRNTWDARFGALFGENLTGAAKLWFQEQTRALRQNYQQLHDGFIARYNTVQWHMENKLNLKTIQRGPNEGIKDYETRVIRAVTNAFPGANNDVLEQKKKDVFLEGLTPPKMREIGYTKSVDVNAAGDYPTFVDIVNHCKKKDVARALAGVYNSDRHTEVSDKIDKLGENLEKILNVSLVQQDNQNSLLVNHLQQMQNNAESFNKNFEKQDNRGTFSNTAPTRTWNPRRNFNRDRFRDNRPYERRPYPSRNYSSRPQTYGSRFGDQNRGNFRGKFRSQGYDPNRPKFNQNMTRFCSYCKRNGHTIGFCIQKQRKENPNGGNRTAPRANMIQFEESEDEEQKHDSNTRVNTVELTHDCLN